MIKKLDVLVLISTLLFYGLPAVYLSWRTPKAVLRTLLFALAMTPPLVFIIDTLAHLTKTWWVGTIFPFRLWGIIPVEDLLWGFLYTYSIVIFYEHFLDKGRHNLVDGRMKYFVSLGLVGSAISF